MLGFRLGFEERETGARRTIPKRRRFSATTDPHLPQRLAASLDPRGMGKQQLKELMSRDVKVISPDVTILDATRKMRDSDFGMMPDGEDDRLTGTISDRDISIRAVAWA